MNLKTLAGVISEWLDVPYFLRFMALLFVLYFGNLAFIAIIDSNGRVYSAFLNNHFNYINWIRDSYLYTSSSMARLAGLNSYIVFPYKIATPNASVTIVYDCLGIGICCFWTAFLWANNNRTIAKIKWWLAGLFSIWMINNIRLTLLLIAVEKQINYNSFMEHHTLYNLVSYSLIALFIYFYMRSSKTYSVQPVLSTISHPATKGKKQYEPL